MGSKDYEFRFDCGVSQAVFNLTLKDRNKIISAMCLHYTILCSLAELEQFRRGLSTGQFSNIIESHSELFRPLFLHSDEHITCSFLQDLYEVEYSPIGSTQRAHEEEIIMAWINFLVECEGWTCACQHVCIEGNIRLLTN